MLLVLLNPLDSTPVLIYINRGLASRTRFLPDFLSIPLEIEKSEETSLQSRMLSHLRCGLVPNAL